MLTVPDIIERLGGMQSVAALLSVSPQAVWNMKDRSAIPPKHWPAVVRAAREKGLTEITFDVLETVHAPAQKGALNGEADAADARGAA